MINVMTAASFGELSFALAFETSSALGSVALGRGQKILGVRHFSKPRAHALEFAPAIQSLCNEHGITPSQIAAVFVSAGPGSFTGLRIGITAARTLALAIGAKVVALPTLEVIAQNALDAVPRSPRVAVVLDAKRARVYTAGFVLKSDRYVAIDEPREADPANYLAPQPRDCAVLGEGVVYHRDAITASGLRVLPDELFAPRVETVYALGLQRAVQGDFVPARDITPVYIRLPEAEEVWAAKQESGKLPGR